MVQTPAKPLSLEEFLKLPETEPGSDYTRPLARIRSTLSNPSVFICVHLWLQIRNQHFCKRSIDGQNTV
jgi:hypothetical protein